LAQRSEHEQRRLPRALAIDAQQQSATILLAWLSFAVRVRQTFRALESDERPNPAPIGVEGLKELIEELIPGSDKQAVLLKGDLGGALERLFEPIQRGERTGVRLDGLLAQRVAWFGALLIDTAHGGAIVGGRRIDPVLRPIPFASGEGFFFPNIIEEFPTVANAGGVAREVVAYLWKFHNEKRRKRQVRGAILSLIRDLYRRIKLCSRVGDPIPYMFQRSAVWTAVFGFAKKAPPEQSHVYLIVREARSPSSPDWNGRHFLVRDMLFLKICGGGGPVEQAYYYSANDDVVYELKEAPGHEQNNYCRLDGAKVMGNVQEHRDSDLAAHKSLSLCVPRAALFGKSDAIVDGLLFAQRGADGIPGSWAVLSARSIEPSVDGVALAMRTLITPADAIRWLKEAGVIGSFGSSHRHRKALRRFLERTHYAEQSPVLKDVDADETRVATIVGDILDHRDPHETTAELAKKVAKRIISSHRRHTARVAARSVILRADHGGSNSAADDVLRRALFALDIGLSAEKAN
jgi:hypothetical protein